MSSKQQKQKPLPTYPTPAVSAPVASTKKRTYPHSPHSLPLHHKERQSSQKGHARTDTSPAVKYYLVAYNALSALGWAYILLTLALHLLGVAPRGGGSGANGNPTAQAQVHSASARLSALLTSYVPLSSYVRGSAATKSVVPGRLQPLLRRAGAAYAAVGPETTLVQSLAALEVLHAAVGWVRSPVRTTAMQVASRLFLVWGVAERFEAVSVFCFAFFSFHFFFSLILSCSGAHANVCFFSNRISYQARTSPLYASMVLAWSLTEVTRYTFYALSLLGSEPHALLWLRYTTFFLLYPLGAGSEAFVNFATLPRASPLPSVGGWVRGAVWTPYDYVRGVLFLVWWPGECSI